MSGNTSVYNHKIIPSAEINTSNNDHLLRCPTGKPGIFKRFWRFSWKKRKTEPKQCDPNSSKTNERTHSEIRTVSDSDEYRFRSVDVLKHLSLYICFKHESANQFQELCSQSWFWGPLTRLEANNLLQDTRTGSFIVRDSEYDSSRFTLTFCCSNGHVLNNRISNQDNFYAFLKGEAFSSIRELVENAMTHSKKGAYCLSQPDLNQQSTENDTETTIDQTLSNETNKFSLKHKQEKAHDDGIWCCAWQKREIDGKEFVITGSLDNTLKLWNWADDELKLITPFEGHRLGIVSVDINREGTMAVSSSLDSQIIFWDLDNKKQLSIYEGTPVDTWSVAFSPDSRYVATGSHTGCINMIGVESGKKDNVIHLDGKFTYCLAYSPDGTKLAAGTINGLVSICDLESGAIFPLDGHAMPVRSVAFSPDSRLLVSTSDDKQIRIYDANDGRLVVSSLNGHSSWVVSAVFSPDNRHLATASTDKTVRVWDILSKTEENVFEEHEDQVWCVRYNHDGTRLMSTGDDRCINMYSCWN